MKMSLDFYVCIAAGGIGLGSCEWVFYLIETVPFI
jgi:hypothetical protein